MKICVCPNLGERGISSGAGNSENKKGYVHNMHGSGRDGKKYVRIVTSAACAYPIGMYIGKRRECMYVGS